MSEPSQTKDPTPGSTSGSTAGSSQAQTPAQPPSLTPAQIEAEIDATRARLAGTVDELATRVQPKEIARRSAQDARAKLQAATHTEDGALRTERVAAIAAAVALLAVLVVGRALRRRRS